MITQLREKEVITRKKHRCFACERVFDAGSIMNYGTYSSEDGIYSLHTCQSCRSLINEFDYGFDDGDWCYPKGCVSGGLSIGQTPEMLLDELRNKKNKTHESLPMH